MQLDNLSVAELIQLQTNIRRKLKTTHLWYETERPDWDIYFSMIAQTVALRGSCVRRKVGAVLVDKDYNTLSTGYNGKATGLPNCTVTPCKDADKGSETRSTSCEAVHAELNAVIRCKEIRDIHTAYVTCSPCTSCVDLLLATGCKRIVFIETYSVSEEPKRRWETSGREWIHLKTLSAQFPAAEKPHCHCTGCN